MLLWAVMEMKGLEDRAASGEEEEEQVEVRGGTGGGVFL